MESRGCYLSDPVSSYSARLPAATKTASSAHHHVTRPAGGHTTECLNSRKIDASNAPSLAREEEKMPYCLRVFLAKLDPERCREIWGHAWDWVSVRGTMQFSRQQLGEYMYAAERFRSFRARGWKQLIRRLGQLFKRKRSWKRRTEDNIWCNIIIRGLDLYMNRKMANDLLRLTIIWGLLTSYIYYCTGVLASRYWCSSVLKQTNLGLKLIFGSAL